MECRSSADLYESYSFHGPHYHSCIEMKRIAERGMLCLAQNQTGKGSLLDVMGQQIGHFLHLTQTENVISFPIRIQELTFFSDIFDQDGVFEHTLIVKRLSKNVAAADMVLKRGGSVWCVARDYIGQRFANFEPVWHVVMKPYYHTLAEEIGRGIYYFENTSRDSYILLLRKLYFNRPEREKYEGLGSNTARNEFLYSRIALKDAVRSFIAKRDGDSEMLYPIEIRCSHDENGRPYIQGSGRASTKAERIFVSLAHKGTAAAAIASEKPVGIDLEKIEEKTEDFLQIAFTDNEIRLIREINNPEAVIRFWAAKEAYAKKTGFGLKGDPKRYEVCAVEGDILYIGDTGVQTVKHGEEYIIGWTL